MSELLGKERKEILKEMIRSLHEGADPEELKAKFKEVLEGVTTIEIARAEEELIKEGLPREEVRRLCEVHLAIFKESLEREKRDVLAPEGHPIHILMEEHRILQEFSEKLSDIARHIEKEGKMEPAILSQLKHIEEHLRESESHYVREENVLFPYLEKHGVTEPPAVMWMEHDQIRGVKKKLYGLIESREEMEFGEFTTRLNEVASSLVALLRNHFHKENSILFPVSLRLLSDEEWKDVRRQFDELGYCCFTPQAAIGRPEEEEVKAPIPTPEVEGEITFETGSLSRTELEAILNTLPVDITFVDKDDTVKYFNQSKERMFPRTKAVIGRNVQKCHPQKSIHIVNRIIEDFKAGRRDVAEFWIQHRGRFVHIRYFPVRSRDGEYLGVLEVTQDITDIKKLEGEKRLLDEQ